MAAALRRSCLRPATAVRTAPAALGPSLTCVPTVTHRLFSPGPVASSWSPISFASAFKPSFGSSASVAPTDSAAPPTLPVPPAVAAVAAVPAVPAVPAVSVLGVLGIPVATSGDVAVFG
ncbi:hypothetical protein ABT330_04365 [Streptomyces sp. NPDC000658]|uniref:hypothetical protein n=1 Tax=Streptomyces sp. NPDC000658 TaxID=3154266 RepID=UPI003330F7C3